MRCPNKARPRGTDGRLEIERMEAEVLDYLTRPADPRQPPAPDFEAHLQNLYRRFAESRTGEAGQISLGSLQTSEVSKDLGGLEVWREVCD